MPKPRHGKKFHARKGSPDRTTAAAPRRQTPPAAPAQIVRREAPVAAPLKRPSGVKASAATLQYPYVVNDLIRVAVATGIVIAALVILALILSAW